MKNKKIQEEQGWEKEFDAAYLTVTNPETWIDGKPVFHGYQYVTLGNALKDVTRKLIHSSNLQLLERIEKEKESKDQAYWERNQLIALLSKLYPSHLSLHDANDADWEMDWRNIVCIHIPDGELLLPTGNVINRTGQATWHIHDSDLKYFEHLEPDYSCKWDGHTTEEKYQKLAAIREEISK